MATRHVFECHWFQRQCDDIGSVPLIVAKKRHSPEQLYLSLSIALNSKAGTGEPMLWHPTDDVSLEDPRSWDGDVMLTVEQSCLGILE